jgi:hypothetical protein
VVPAGPEGLGAGEGEVEAAASDRQVGCRRRHFARV